MTLFFFLLFLAITAFVVWRRHKKDHPDKDTW